MENNEASRISDYEIIPLLSFPFPKRIGTKEIVIRDEYREPSFLTSTRN